MGFYAKWILPRLVDIAMRNKEATRYRSQIMPQARGTILEIGGGCNLNRKIDDLLAQAGFRVVDIQTEYAKGPKPMSFIYCGRARPA